MAGSKGEGRAADLDGEPEVLGLVLASEMSRGEMRVSAPLAARCGSQM